MKEQEKKKDIFQILVVIIIGMTAFLSIIQAVMLQSWLLVAMPVIYVIAGVIFLYQDKSKLYRNINTGHKAGFLMMLLGILCIDASMMFQCQIPDFAMKLIWTGWGIFVVSYFYGAIKAKR
jgi:hypothetical protein